MCCQSNTIPIKINAPEPAILPRLLGGVLTSVLCAFAFTGSVAQSAVLKAFPTAEGFGADAVGGSGGRVIEVTNLDDAGNNLLCYGTVESGVHDGGTQLYLAGNSGLNGFTVLFSGLEQFGRVH